MEGSVWGDVVAAAGAAPYPVEILPVGAGRVAGCLALPGVASASWLGAVVAHCGGLLVDHGWLRVLGSGSPGLPDVTVQADPVTGWLVVGHDVLGGQFALARSAPAGPATVRYFAPDECGWRDLRQDYAAWLRGVLAGSLTGFHAALRWPGWEAEVAAVPVDQGIATYPPLWTVGGRSLAVASRKAVPMVELTAFHRETARQLGSADDA